jgi:hypothetical protein
LDRAAYVDDMDSGRLGKRDPWKLCTVTQVEEVKSILRLLSIWFCTILYSVVFTQMASMFVVQGAAMRRTTPITGFFIPTFSPSPPPYSSTGAPSARSWPGSRGVEPAPPSCSGWGSAWSWVRWP